MEIQGGSVWIQYEVSLDYNNHPDPDHLLKFFIALGEFVQYHCIKFDDFFPDYYFGDLVIVTR